MSKIALYVLLIISYLGISKSFSPTELGIAYINEKEQLAQLTQESPVSIILTNIHSTGLFIKTYYHNYKLIYGVKDPEEIVVRASKHFSQNNKDFIGMSIFRRSVRDGTENYTPLPPGSIFISDPAFGRWRKNKNNIEMWYFHRYYRYLPKALGWGTFRPNLEFNKTLKLHIEQNKPFFGMNNEFGTNGENTKKYFTEYYENQKIKSTSIKDLMLEYLKENFYNKI